MPKDPNKGRLLGVHCSIAGGVENAPLAGDALGCTAIQLFTTNNQQWRPHPISDASAAAFRENMRCTRVRVAFAHAIYLINLAAPDRSVHARSLRAMVGELERAQLLGLPFVVVHPGAPKDRGRDWGVRRVAESIDRVIEKTPGSRVRIALETTAGLGSTLGGRFEELAAIIDRVGDKRRVAVCFDTCHAFAAGYDIATKLGYAKSWKQFDRTVGFKRLVALHLNDSQTELGSRRDRHEQLGEGRIGRAGFRLLMNDARLAHLPMVIETPKVVEGQERDPINLGFLRRLIRS